MPLRLIGSKLESTYRQQLIESNRALFDGSTDPRILEKAREAFPDLETAYTIDWIPNQGEDTYTLLVDLESLLTIEVDRADTSSPAILLGRKSVEEYDHGRSRIGRVKLAVALDLARSDRRKHET